MHSANRGRRAGSRSPRRQEPETPFWMRLSKHRLPMYTLGVKDLVQEPLPTPHDRPPMLPWHPPSGAKPPVDVTPNSFSNIGEMNSPETLSGSVNRMRTFQPTAALLDLMDDNSELSAADETDTCGTPTAHHREGDPTRQQQSETPTAAAKVTAVEGATPSVKVTNSPVHVARHPFPTEAIAELEEDDLTSCGSRKRMSYRRDDTSPAPVVFSTSMCVEEEKEPELIESDTSELRAAESLERQTIQRLVDAKWEGWAQGMGERIALEGLLLPNNGPTKKQLVTVSDAHALCFEVVPMAFYVRGVRGVDVGDVREFEAVCSPKADEDEPLHRSHVELLEGIERAAVQAYLNGALRRAAAESYVSWDEDASFLKIEAYTEGFGSLAVLSDLWRRVHRKEAPRAATPIETIVVEHIVLDTPAVSPNCAADVTIEESPNVQHRRSSRHPTTTAEPDGVVARSFAHAEEEPAPSNDAVVTLETEPIHETTQRQRQQQPQPASAVVSPRPVLSPSARSTQDVVSPGRAQPSASSSAVSVHTWDTAIKVIVIVTVLVVAAGAVVVLYFLGVI